MEARYSVLNACWFFVASTTNYLEEILSPEVHVEHADGDADGERDQDHGEEEVLAQERHRQRGGRDDLGEKQEEHSQRHQDRTAEGHLQPIRRSVIECCSQK